MQKTTDAYKLKENAHLFIGKPLNNLLKEIAPEIKMVFVEANRGHCSPSYIIFKFVNWADYWKYNCAGKKPLSIRVILNEHFEWNKPKEDFVKWTKEDESKFGNLTIAYISVYGEVYEEGLAL